MRDNIFNKPIDLIDFCFNQQVVKVFDDMVVRSVPGYKNILELIAIIANTYAQEKTNLYDLGCSTGATSLALNNTDTTTHIIAIDSSKEMVKQCKINLKKIANIEVICDDIANINIKNASIVVLNLTLQFIGKAKRQALINKIYQGLNSNGILIISEKINFTDKKVDDFINNLHLNFKKANGYSNLEIYNKRQMLDKILIADTKTEHIKRFKNANFKFYTQIFQSLNFQMLIALK